jgi:bacterial/archaeal transporter family-2 protein
VIVTKPVPPAAGPDHHQRRRAIGLALAVLGGVGVAVQSRINGELGDRLHDGVAAAVISFGTGMLVLLVLVVLLPGLRRALAAIRRAIRARKLAPWQCLGGACGAYLVATQGITVTTLGVAVFTVALVAGQSAASLVVDRLGLGPAGPQQVTAQRLAGAALGVIAVLVAVSGRLGDPGALGLAALPALAGLGVAWQQAVNGRVRDAAGSPLAATVVNFAVGTTALLLVLGVDVLVRGEPSGALPANPVLYLGGLLGIAFIAMAAAVVRFTGVLLLGLGMVAGQLLGALALDLLVPDGGHPDTATYVGVALTLGAVALAAAPARTRRVSNQ